MMELHYPGIDDDKYGGMTSLGKIVRDGWVFGLIPESERCVGWSHGQMQVLYDQTTAEWDRYGNLPSRLPSELRERHDRIYHAAVEQARELGWNPELGDDD